MASIDRRPDGRWRARWREYPGGPQRARHFSKKADAERHLVQVRHDLLTGRYVDPALGRTTFAEVAERYLARGAWRDRTRSTATERLRRAVDTFGDRPVASIRRGDVQAFISVLTLAPSTVRVVHQHLAAALESAVDDGLIATNPARRIKLPRVDSPPVVPLTSAELDRLLDVVPTWFRPAIVLGAGLGLRLGEAAGLTVDRVDFLRRSVRVDRQWQQPSGTTAGRFVPPKTTASSRTVPASAEVLDALAAYLHSHGAGGSAGFIVHRDGRPIAAPTWEHQVRRARRLAEIEDVTFHDLRHYFASALIAAGCSVKAVQTAMGHASAKMTLDTYTHLWPGDDDRIRAAIGAAFCEVSLDPLRTG